MAKRSRPFQSALPAVGVDQAQDRLGDGGLAGAALADDGEDLALLQLEGDVVERLERAVGLGGALDLEDRLARPRPAAFIAPWPGAAAISLRV